MKTLTLQEIQQTLDKAWSRGQIPEYANDVKIVVQSLISQAFTAGAAAERLKLRERGKEEIKKRREDTEDNSDDEEREKEMLWVLKIAEDILEASLETEKL